MSRLLSSEPPRRLSLGQTGLPRLIDHRVGRGGEGAAGFSSWLYCPPLGHWLTGPKVRAEGRVSAGSVSRRAELKV